MWRPGKLLFSSPAFSVCGHCLLLWLFYTATQETARDRELYTFSCVVVAHFGFLLYSSSNYSFKSILVVMKVRVLIMFSFMGLWKCSDEWTYTYTQTYAYSFHRHLLEITKPCEAQLLLHNHWAHFGPLTRYLCQSTHLLYS